MSKSSTAGASASAVLARKGREAKPLPHINFCCPAFGPADGYGNSAEQMCLALERAGVSLSLAGITRAAGTPNSDMLKREFQRGEIIVFYSTPLGWMEQHQPRRAVGFSMYEADELPSSWIQALIRVDEIWVPSEWNAEIFRKYTDKKINIVPLGVDANAFPARRRVRGDKLRFLFYATYADQYRKGADLAMKAFSQAFPDRDDVELVVHSSFRHELQRNGDPRILFTTRRLTTSELNDSYGKFDALLYPSRGEGFGLIPLEAMATGMPAIFPASTGMLSYANLGLTVGTREVPAVDMDAPPTANLFEPDIDAVVAHLRTVDTEYDFVQEMAMENAKVIAQEWSWDRSAARIKELLSEE